MFAKIFEQIFDSSIAEDWQVRVVFQDMLVLADKDGIVDRTPEAISRRTNVPLDLVLKAIPILESTDALSRTQDHDGRRIVRLDDHRPWGWQIVNFKKYRESATRDMLRMAEADRKRAYRERHGAPPHTPPKEIQAEAEAEADMSMDMSRTLVGDDFLEAWKSWIKHRREIRHKLTPTTKSRQLQALAMMGKEKAIQSINQSIANGWQGLFEPRTEKQATKTAISPSVEAIQRGKELEEVNKLIAALRQDGHMEMDDEDRKKLKELKARQKELKQQLGWKV